MSTFNRALLLANLLIGAFLLGSASSQSVSAVESNVITACANKTTGALRISSKCSKSERLITWNKTGLAGPKGDTGSNALLNTKTITIYYNPVDWPKFSNCPPSGNCGSGNYTYTSLPSDVLKYSYDGAKVGIDGCGDGTRMSVTFPNGMTDGVWQWNTQLGLCYITLKVVE